MNTSGQPSGGGSPTVSPLMIPLLFLGIIIGFIAGYFFVWWGLIAVIAVLVAAASMVLTGRSRDGATGAVAGVVLGYAGVILLALFRGVL
ncbi:hypothetical protein ACT3SQ_11590 [Brachybacterium sp. AOP42-C2-15]|uniref:hypothetical protein n=1 Tax=unclassified Brachybacterium TaxID=2623841 RepID=UPI004034F586